MQGQVIDLQLLTFLVNKYNYQIVNIRGLQTSDFWLVNFKANYPLICITHVNRDEPHLASGTFSQVYHAIASTIQRKQKLLILNTNEQAISFETPEMIIRRIETRIMDSFLLDEFNGIEEAVHEVKNVNNEKRKLTKVLQAKARSEFFKNFKASNTTPRLTYFILLICVVYFLFASFIKFSIGNESVAAILAGAYYKMNVVSAFEYWRLFTSGFLHVDFFHLFMNMMALFNVGTVVERIFKRSHYAIILIASILVGNLFVFIAHANSVGLGISGGIFGLLGAYIVYLYAYGAFKNKMILANFIQLLTVNILISLMPGISLLGHLGGFVTGILLGMVFVEHERLAGIKKHALASFALLIGCCGARIPSVLRVEPAYPAVDAAVVHVLRETPLKAYGDYLSDRYVAQMTKQNSSSYLEKYEYYLNGGK